MNNQWKKTFRPEGLFLCLLLSFASLEAQDLQLAKLPADTVWEESPDTIAPLSRADLVWTISGVGDIMLGTNYPDPKYLPPNDGADLLEEVKPYLQSVDVAFGNLEGTMLNEGGTPKRCKNPDACYVFRSPEHYGAYLAEAGFDLMSIANNHSGDFGLEGRLRTKAVLDEHGIAYAGLAETDEYTVVTRFGLRVGMVAFSPNTGTVSIHDYAKARELVQFMEDTCDVVMVSFHGGAEGPDHQHVPRKPEQYYGENRGDVHRFAHAMVDAGADVVFGHGPHVTRGAELYKERFIIYSLGNFCTYGRFNLRGQAGIAPFIQLQIDFEGRFLSGQVIPVYQGYSHGPRIDDRMRAVDVLQRLSEADFPESELVIEPDGHMHPFVEYK